MNRRQFVTVVGSTLAIAGGGNAVGQELAKELAKEVLKETPKSAVEPFQALFAPNASHFGGGKTIEKYLEALQRAYDNGFRAWEDNWLVRRAAEEQEKIGEFLRDKGMTMGVSVVTTGQGAYFFEASEEEQKKVLEDCKKAVECAKRVGHKWFTLLPGTRDGSKPLQAQLEGSVDLLKRCSDIFEEADLIYVMEPLSHGLAKKPVLLETFQEGAELCKLVNRPSCKLLTDYYHQRLSSL